MVAMTNSISPLGLKPQPRAKPSLNEPPLKIIANKDPPTVPNKEIKSNIIKNQKSFTKKLKSTFKPTHTKNNGIKNPNEII